MPPGYSASTKRQPGQSATYGSFTLGTSANGQTLVVNDSSNNGQTTNIPVSSLSGNLSQGTLATTNSTYSTLVTNLNNAAGTGATTSANGQVTTTTGGLPLGMGRIPAQLNSQLG